jgi:Gluconate 2-dehydrogenase subunit 3
MGAPTAKTPSFFTDAQRALLTTILNRLVPASGDFPGAGDLGIANYLDSVVGRSTEWRRLFAHGMVQVDIFSQEQFAGAFINLADDQKDGVLCHLEHRNPEFFSALVTHTYSGYYSHAAVLRLLSRDARPPQPKGYDLEPFDLSLLANVKQRGPMYRQAS